MSAGWDAWLSPQLARPWPRTLTAHRGGPGGPSHRGGLVGILAQCTGGRGSLFLWVLRTQPGPRLAVRVRGCMPRESVNE